jgi:hypothetical protein
MDKGVSGYTHSQDELDDYANQNNPNNQAYCQYTVPLHYSAIYIVRGIKTDF